MGKMFMIDRFKITQQNFNNSLKLWAIVTISLSFHICHVRCSQKVLDILSKNEEKILNKEIPSTRPSRIFLFLEILRINTLWTDVFFKF